jgi:hypothetical protein
MERINLLLPDVNMAHRVVDRLLAAGVEWSDIHILANPNISLDELPDADLPQKSDLLPALARGTAVGGLVGMVAGLVALSLPPAGVVIAGGALLGTTIGGAGIGAWAAALVGVSVPNSQLEQYEDAINRGELLLLVDTPQEREEELKSLIKSEYSAADFNSTHQNPPELKSE